MNIITNNMSIILYIIHVRGEMAERSKAADCKSVRNTHVGSNPTFLIFF